MPPLQTAPSLVTCTYEDRQHNAEELCNLWCEIQTFSGKKCTSCPDEYNAKVESELLCRLWEQLETLESNSGSSSAIFIPPVPTTPTLIFCPYSENENDAAALCKLFCRIQALDGMQCTDCPKEFESKVERELLCQLWNELEELGDENGTQTQTIASVLAPITCIYENQLNDALELCDLWCKIQVYKGHRCSQCPSVYLDKIETELLCQLWDELETLQSNPSQSVTSSPTLQPVTCVHQEKVNIFFLLNCIKGE